MNVMWKDPTPHQQSLDQIDDWLANHIWTPKELDDVRRFYGSKRMFGLRHLRLSAAESRVRSMIGQPTIILA